MSVMPEPTTVTVSPTATEPMVLDGVVVPLRVKVRMVPATFQVAPPKLPPRSRKEWPLFRERNELRFALLMAGALVLSEKVSSTLSPASFAPVPPVFFAIALCKTGPAVSAVRELVVTAPCVSAPPEVRIWFAGRVALTLSAGADPLQDPAVAKVTKNMPVAGVEVEVATVVVAPTLTVD